MNLDDIDRLWQRHAAWHLLRVPSAPLVLSFLGRHLSCLARGAEFVPIDLPLRGPAAADLGDHFDAARDWADSI